MGIIANLKTLAPLSLYLLGGVAFFLSLSGKVRWGMAMVALLLPLRNVIEKMQELPLGAQFIDILIFGMIIGWLVSTSERKPLMEKSPLNASSILMMIYLFFSLLIGSMTLTGSISFSLDDHRVQDWKNFCLLPVLFFITFNNITDKKWVWRIFTIMCFALVLVDYYTISQIRDYSSLEARAKIQGTFQFLGPNEVAAFINQCTVILTGVYFCMKKSRYKLLLLALILVNVYCVLFLYSRAAYIGLTLGMVVLFIFKNQKLLIPLILVAAFWQAVLPEKVIERIMETKDSTGQLDESSEMRLKMWEKGIELFQSSPIVGIGFGVFRNLGLELGDTHNIYVKILTEQGLLGLLLFLIVVFCFMYEGFRLYQKGDDDISKGLGLGLFACMFTLLINNFFGDRWSYFELSSYLWVYVGLVARLNYLSSNKGPESQTLQTVKATNTMRDKPKPKPRKSYYK